MIARVIKTMGLSWFHPHIHGVALNQVSEGMAGIITIGSPSAAELFKGQRGPSGDCYDLGRPNNRPNNNNKDDKRPNAALHDTYSEAKLAGRRCT